MPAGASPRLTATGRVPDLSPEAFGQLRRSDDACDDAAELRRRMADDGYLFLPGYLDRAEVLFARRYLLARADELGWLPDGPDRDEIIHDPNAKGPT